MNILPDTVRIVGKISIPFSFLSFAKKYSGASRPPGQVNQGPDLSSRVLGPPGPCYFDPWVEDSGHTEWRLHVLKREGLAYVEF